MASSTCPSSRTARRTRARPRPLGEPVAARPGARDEQPRAGVGAADRGEGGDEVVDALLPLQAPEVDEARRAVAIRRGAGAAHPEGSMPLCTTVTSSGSRSKSPETSARMACEQVTTASARRASHHSTECTCWLSGCESQPPCRPASVACSVATSGAPVRSASAIAAWATSQSWAWTTSGVQSRSRPARRAQHRVAQPEGPGDEVADELQVRRVLGHAQDAHARRRARSSSGASRRRCRRGGGRRRPRRAPRRRGAVASAWTWRPSPPTTTGGYSQDSISTRTRELLPAIRVRGVTDVQCLRRHAG